MQTKNRDAGTVPTTEIMKYSVTVDPNRQKGSKYLGIMATAIKDQKYTLDEYFERELASEERLEFWDGHIWSMAGASPEHERVVSNSIFHLRSILRRSCSVLGSNLRVKVPAYGPYRYPDLSVYCGKGVYEKMGGIDVLTNPEMVIEVLSSTTESFDRGDKFLLYKSIPSLKEYLLISTSRPGILQLVRSENGDWIRRDAGGLDGELYLPSVDATLLLSEVYLDVEFPEPKHDLYVIE